MGKPLSLSQLRMSPAEVATVATGKRPDPNAALLLHHPIYATATFPAKCAQWDKWSPTGQRSMAFKNYRTLTEHAIMQVIDFIIGINMHINNIIICHL